MTALQRRLDRMEAHSTWGRAAEIAASEVLFMRIPGGAVDDPRVTAAHDSAARKGKHLNITTAPEAGFMPLWAPIPLERIPDALLEARIAELQIIISQAECNR